MKNSIRKATHRAMLGMAIAVAVYQAQRQASSNFPGAEYPKIHDDLRVTFRVSAPLARKVQLQPGGGDNGLEQGAVRHGPRRQRVLGRYHATVAARLPRPTTHRARPASAGARKRAASKFRTRWTFTSPRPFRTAMCAPDGTCRRSLDSGGGRTSILRRITIRIRRRGSGALSAARVRRERAGVAASGPSQFHPGQSDRRQERKADDHRAGEWWATRFSAKS